MPRSGHLRGRDNLIPNQAKTWQQGKGIFRLNIGPYEVARIYDRLLARKHIATYQFIGHSDNLAELLAAVIIWSEYSRYK